LTPISPPLTRKRVQSDPKHGPFSSDGLSEVSEADEIPSVYEPSPRRLRSRGDRSSQDSGGAAGRHLPVRTVRPKIGELQEVDTESSAAGSDEEGVPASSAIDTDRDEDDEDSEYDEEIEPSPRKLRNGKVRVPDHPDDDDDSEEEEEEEADTSGDTEYMEEDEEEDTEVAEEVVDEEEGMDDEDVDLSEQTVKTLTRFRRDHLVRLCESRNLDVDGTKPQLAKALLEWVRLHLL
jgi:mitogen-activated protein kinase kinase kinase 13